MAQFGILPTPNSPMINSTDMNCYIKRSFYPIPYQVVSVVESCNVDSITSWDINVTTKSIKVKIQYDLLDKFQANNNIDLFPKAVINSIQTYNIDQPTWSTSFNRKKLCLKIDWKLTLPNHISPNSPSKFSTPTNLTSTDNMVDSGYKSFNYSSNCPSSGFQTPLSTNNSYILSDSRNVNKVNSENIPELPRTKLFHSPRKQFIQHDIYRPKTAISKIPSDSKVPGDISTKPSDSSNKSIPEINVNSPGLVHDVTRVTVEAASEIPLTNCSDSNGCPDDHSISDIDSRSDDDPKCFDSKVLDDFDPENGKFCSPPDELTFVNGFLDDQIDAEFMNLIGSCRLCNDEIPSYFAQRHLINCSKLDLKPVHDFMVEFADKLETSIEVVAEISRDYLAFKYNDSKVPNDTFKTVEQYREFTSAIDELCDGQTQIFFDQCGLTASRPVDILKYPIVP